MGKEEVRFEMAEADFYYRLLSMMRDPWGGLLGGRCQMEGDCNLRCGNCQISRQDLMQVRSMMAACNYLCPNNPPFVVLDKTGLAFFYGEGNVGVFKVRQGELVLGVFNWVNNAYPYRQGEGAAERLPTYNWSKRSDLLSLNERLTIEQMLDHRGGIPLYFGQRGRRMGAALWQRGEDKT